MISFHVLYLFMFLAQLNQYHNILRPFCSRIGILAVVIASLHVLGWGKTRFRNQGGRKGGGGNRHNGQKMMMIPPFPPSFPPSFPWSSFLCILHWWRHSLYHPSYCSLAHCTVRPKWSETSSTDYRLTIFVAYMVSMSRKDHITCVYRLGGQNWLDKTVDHICGIFCSSSKSK